MAPFQIMDQEIVSQLSKIKELAGEQNLNNMNATFQIEDDMYKADSTNFKQLFDDLKDLISKTHFKQLPSIALAVAFDLRYKKDVFGLWEYISNEAFKVLHNMEIMELAKLNYAFKGSKPNVYNNNL